MARTERTEDEGEGAVPELELDRRPSAPARAPPPKKQAPPPSAGPPSAAEVWDDDDGGAKLELDDPRERRAARPEKLVVTPPHGSGAEIAEGDAKAALARTIVETTVPKPSLGPRPDDPAVMLASYPPSPARLWETPGYAARVLIRRRMLKRALEQRREALMPDIALYHRALTVHDARAVYTGVALSVIVFVIAATLFCLPVIVRFARLAAQD